MSHYSELNLMSSFDLGVQETDRVKSAAAKGIIFAWILPICPWMDWGLKTLKRYFGI